MDLPEFGESDVACMTSPESQEVTLNPASDATFPILSQPMLLQKLVHRDHRGWVYEAWRGSNGFKCEQVTIVGCERGLWKGAHYHPSKHSLWTCVSGRVLARIGEAIIPLKAGDGIFVYIPATTVHDVMGLERRNVIVELDTEEFVEGDKIRV